MKCSHCNHTKFDDFGYEYVRCSRCGLTRKKDDSTEFINLYRNNFQKLGINLSRLSHNLHRFGQARLRALLNFLKGY